MLPVFLLVQLLQFTVLYSTVQVPVKRSAERQLFATDCDVDLTSPADAYNRCATDMVMCSTFARCMRYTMSESGRC
jgi:hypothetical protein